jgi:ligand-binding sensor protein
VKENKQGHMAQNISVVIIDSDIESISNMGNYRYRVVIASEAKQSRPCNEIATHPSGVRNDDTLW